MNALVIGLFLIPLADQGLKLLLRRRLGSRSVSLGPMGSVRMMEGRIWLKLLPGNPHPAMLWSVWVVAAVLLSLLTNVLPACAGFAALLLGGSLSHALENSFRGCVSDYVCLRFWPAFNLADVAITLGAIGVALEALPTVKGLL